MGLTSNVNVRKHIRRRTGRSAEIAKRLGFPDTVTVEGFERRRPKERPVSAGGVYRGEQHFQRMYPNEAYVASIERPTGPDEPWTWEVYYHGLEFTSGLAKSRREAEQKADRAVSKHQREHP